MRTKIKVGKDFFTIKSNYWELPYHLMWRGKIYQNKGWALKENHHKDYLIYQEITVVRLKDLNYARG